MTDDDLPSGQPNFNLPGDNTQKSADTRKRKEDRAARL